VARRKPSPFARAIESFQDVTVTRGDIRVTWAYIDEGQDGEYNPDDPADIPLLRFSCERAQGSEPDWVEVPDGSYCTRLPVDTPVRNLVRAAIDILEALEQPSPKRRLEALSWLEPGDFPTGGGQ
jgi:hypothetical protein